MEKTVLIALAVIGAILFFGLVTPQVSPPAEEGQLIDSGQFIVMQGGTQAIDEQYTLFFSAKDGYMLLSQATLNVSGQKITMAQQYELDRNFVPIIYHVAADTPSGSQIISAQMGIKGLHMELHVGTAQQENDVAGKSIVILDNNLTSHYVPLLLALQAGAIQSKFTAAIPQALLSLPGTITGPQDVSFTSGGASYTGERYDVHLADLGIILIAYKNKVAAVINPAQGVTAYNAQTFPNGVTVAEAAAPAAEGTVDKDVSFTSEGVTLAGTLTLPAAADGPVPGVLLLAGSGPVDRNENAPGMKTDILSTIATSLARIGIGSFRYDKRGVGQSEGTFSAASMDDLVADAREALTIMKSEQGIDPARTFILGHSEGGIIGPILAAEDQTLDGLILLAGPAHSLDWIIRGQVERAAQAAGKTDAEIQTVLEQEDQYLGFVRESAGEWTDYTFDDLKQAMPWITQDKYKELTALPLSWLRQHFLHNPLATIRQVTCPVLIIQGEKDIQVPANEADLLASALKDAGNSDVTLSKIPDLNHMMRYHPEEPNFTYRHLDEPVDQRVLDAITGWMNSHVVQ